MFGFTEPIHAVIIGGNGQIGRAFIQKLCASSHPVIIKATTRQIISEPTHNNVEWLTLDLENESDIANLSDQFRKDDFHPNLILNCSGILHRGTEVGPERSWRELNFKKMETVFRINCFSVALLGKHLLPLVPRNGRSIFASISARVGSIEDNRLGGWYSYRASKAAQNMMVKTLSIEAARKWSELICVTLHPGTVESPLSEPFTKNYPKHKLFSPDRAVEELSGVLENLTAIDSGGFFAWDGSKILF
jgi:NAD(P)-dependent dehydrogenase (short-subunit alcohol dehydrogenase family)